MFQLPELRLLADSVQSSRFITRKKSLELIAKLEGLTSVHQAKELRRQVVVKNRIKAMNESIYYLVDELHNAINGDKRIRFHYTGYDGHGRRVLRRGGAWYDVSPYALLWDDENYYLIGYDSAFSEIRHFRVDKISDLCTAGDGRAPDYDDWDLNGDIIFRNTVLDRAFEVSSMGIRVSPESMDRQLTLAWCDDRRKLPFHKALLAGEMPFTMGGGVGQSRLCMLLIGCAHIGEVQSGIWDEETVNLCKARGVHLL